MYGSNRWRNAKIRKIPCRDKEDASAWVGNLPVAVEDEKVGGSHKKLLKLKEEQKEERVGGPEEL